MFTGLIEETGIVKSIIKNNDNFILTIFANKIPNEIKIGDSVAINGVCTTVIKKQDNTFSVELSKSTLNVTTLKDLKIDDYVNLERTLTLNSRLDGHLVYGHVDFIAPLNKKEEISNSVFLTFEVPDEYSKYFVNKGSVTINGISLTISDKNNKEITVCIIPHTYKNTNLKYLKINDYVNIEIDVIAKYVENYMNLNNNSNRESKLTKEFLLENGF